MTERKCTNCGQPIPEFRAAYHPHAVTCSKKCSRDIKRDRSREYQRRLKRLAELAIEHGLDA